MRSMGWACSRWSCGNRRLPLGICGLIKREGLEDVDIGFAFLERHWGRGYAVEAAAAALEHGFRTLGLLRIVAITAPGNQGSIRVLERIGLRFEGMISLAQAGGENRLYGLAAKAASPGDPPAPGVCSTAEES